MSGRVLIYGGKGALGAKCVEHFKSRKWWICSVDFSANEEADANVLVKESADWSQQAHQVTEDVKAALDGKKIDAVLCVAGGWAGGNASHKDFIQSCDRMWKQSVWTSTIAAQLAATHLKEGGLLQLTGAKAALDETPGMIGYGMAKAAVHQLVQSMQAKKSGLPADACAVAILPITLDTPANRSGMPNADHSSWTPLEFVAQCLFDWSNDASKRPEAGSLVKLITQGGKTDLIIGK